LVAAKNESFTGVVATFADANTGFPVAQRLVGPLRTV
jgi:hypothetical protein